MASIDAQQLLLHNEATQLPTATPAFFHEYVQDVTRAESVVPADHDISGLIAAVAESPPSPADLAAPVSTAVKQWHKDDDEIKDDKVPMQPQRVPTTTDRGSAWALIRTHIQNNTEVLATPLSQHTRHSSDDSEEEGEISERFVTETHDLAEQRVGSMTETNEKKYDNEIRTQDVHLAALNGEASTTVHPPITPDDPSGHAMETRELERTSPFYLNATRRSPPIHRSRLALMALQPSPEMNSPAVESLRSSSLKEAGVLESHRPRASAARPTRISLKAISYIEGDITRFPMNLENLLQAYCTTYQTQDPPCAEKKWKSRISISKSRSGMTAWFETLAGNKLSAARFNYAGSQQLLIVQDRGPIRWEGGETRIIVTNKVYSDFFMIWRGQKLEKTVSRKDLCVRRKYAAAGTKPKVLLPQAALKNGRQLRSKTMQFKSNMLDRQQADVTTPIMNASILPPLSPKGMHIIRGSQAMHNERTSVVPNLAAVSNHERLSHIQHTGTLKSVSELAVQGTFYRPRLPATPVSIMPSSNDLAQSVLISSTHEGTNRGLSYATSRTVLRPSKYTDVGRRSRSETTISELDPSRPAKRIKVEDNESDCADDRFVRFNHIPQSGASFIGLSSPIHAVHPESLPLQLKPANNNAAGRGSPTSQVVKPATMLTQAAGVDYMSRTEVNSTPSSAAVELLTLHFVFRNTAGHPCRQRPFETCNTYDLLFQHAWAAGIIDSDTMGLIATGSGFSIRLIRGDEEDFRVLRETIYRQCRHGSAEIDITAA